MDLSNKCIRVFIVTFLYVLEHGENKGKKSYYDNDNKKKQGKMNGHFHEIIMLMSTKKNEMIVGGIVE